MIQRLSILFFCLFVFNAEAIAQNIRWNNPEVVPEKLYRANRRVLRFTGSAKPGTQVRVRDNKVKMIFSKTNIRWARIPQKHRVQFPVIASETGYLSFELYLPTTPVEIPLEVFRNGKWVPYTFNFDVPEEGKASDFEFAEDNFRTRRDEENVKVEDFLSEYDKTEDIGQVVNDRGEWKSWATGKVLVWGTLGLSYYNMTEDISPGADLGSYGGASFPSWEVGGEYRWDPQWKAELAYINRAAEAESDGNYTMQSNEFNWSEFRAQVSYYPLSFESEKARWGVKGGVQMHELPYVKQTGPTFYRMFDNSVTFLTIGGNYETMIRGGWNYDITALFMYPVITGGEFDTDSAYGLNLSFAMLKEIIPALYLGGKADFHYLMLETTHRSLVSPTIKASADVDIWQLTPSFVLKAEF